MKKLIFVLSFLIAQPVLAQLKIGYVDSDAILSQLADAQDAQKKTRSNSSGMAGRIE